jgi:hypothetical protein
MSHAHTFHKGDFKCLAQLARCPLTLWMSWQGILMLKEQRLSWKHMLYMVLHEYLLSGPVAHQRIMKPWRH